MSKWRFLGRFLVVFATLLGVWHTLDATSYYTAVLLLLGSGLGPMLHGWLLDTAPAGGGGPVWLHGGERVQLAIQFDALAVGIIPLLALLAATPGLRWRRRLALMAVGAALCLAVDTLIVTAFPLLVFYKNAFTDVIGTFLGLIAFVGAPAIIWFALTFRELRDWLPPLRPRGAHP